MVCGQDMVLRVCVEVTAPSSSWGEHRDVNIRATEGGGFNTGGVHMTRNSCDVITASTAPFHLASSTFTPALCLTYNFKVLVLQLSDDIFCYLVLLLHFLKLLL